MEKVSNEPLISVIVPVYKVEEYLDKCVESIVNQTYTNLEIILVDDGSPDACPKMCDEWAKKDDRIKVIHKENGGVSSARNVGIDIAKGEYIGFIDSDDWVEKEYIRDMYNKLIQTSSNYICCGYNKIYHNKKESINFDERIKEFNSDDYIGCILNVQKGYGFVHMKLINRKVISNIRFNEKLVVGEDALFNIQLCANIDKAVVYNKVLYNYVVNLNSVVRRYDENYVKKYTDSMFAMQSYIEDKYQDNESIKTNLQNYIVYHLMLILVNYCYHPSNPNKHDSLKKTCNLEIYKNAIKKCNYDNLSFTRKVTLFTIKHKLYFLTALICKIRQAQIRK